MSLSHPVQIRLDVPDSDNNIVMSCIGVKKGDKQMIIDSPMNRSGVKEYNSIQERLECLLVKIMNYTSKLVGVDELSGKLYRGTSEYDNDIHTYRLRGTDGVNRHHCAGNVNYHPDNEHMLFWLELMMWNSYKIIPSDYHNLNNINVKVLRSSGNIDVGYIKDSPIRWSNTYKEFGILVLLDGDLEKTILLSKFRKLNPDIELSIDIPSIGGMDIPDWVICEYTSWIEKITIDLNGTAIC